MVSLLTFEWLQYSWILSTTCWKNKLAYLWGFGDHSLVLAEYRDTLETKDLTLWIHDVVKAGILDFRGLQTTNLSNTEHPPTARQVRVRTRKIMRRLR